MSSGQSYGNTNNSDLQRDSLDRGGRGDLRQFDSGVNPQLSGGHMYQNEGDVLRDSTRDSTRDNSYDNSRRNDTTWRDTSSHGYSDTRRDDNVVRDKNIDLQADSLDRGGAGDLRQFASGPNPAISGGHIGIAPSSRTAEQIGSVVSGSALNAGTMGGVAGMGRHTDNTMTSSSHQGQTGLTHSLDVPGATLGERLKNAVVQTLHESQTNIGNDMPPGHYEHNTAHVNLKKTYGAASNPPDLLRDDDLERNHDQARKRSNFELSDAGRVEILPTTSAATDMGTNRMGVPAKESYGGGVGVPPHTSGQYTDSQWVNPHDSSHVRSDTTWQGQDSRHWTEKAADAIEDTKAKISETTHAAVNMAKGKSSSSSTSHRQ